MSLINKDTLKEVLNNYHGQILTVELIKKILKESETHYIDVNEYYHD